MSSSLMPSLSFATSFKRLDMVTSSSQPDLAAFIMGIKDQLMITLPKGELQYRDLSII